MATVCRQRPGVHLHRRYHLGNNPLTAFANTCRALIKPYRVQRVSLHAGCNSGVRTESPNMGQPQPHLKGTTEMKRTYADRRKAIQREIIDPIEAGGNAKAENFEIDLIADRVLGDYDNRFALKVGEIDFWEIVAEHAI